MKQLFTFVLVLISIASFGQQLQNNAPWAANALSKNSGNPTFEQITKSAQDYFLTIDKNKKGSGLKPFERWKYHWSHFLDESGRIQSTQNLWDAWERKNAMNASSRMVDVSNWGSIGPYSHTNTASWSAGQGRVNVAVVDPNDSNTLYVGTPAGGIWKSTDNGVNWTPLTDHLPQIGVSGIAIDPTDSNIIYIATGDDDAGDSSSVGVWKSTDGGTNWNATGTLNATSMNDIYISPTNTSIVVVATNNGVYKTTDAGTSWTQKLSGNIRALRMRPNDPSIWYAVSSGTFYRSFDSGESFQPVTITGLTGASRLEIDVTPADADYVYIVKANNGNTFGGIWKSTDGGVNFSKTSQTGDIFESTQSWYDLALGVSDTDENKLFVGVLNVWRSENGGNNFTKINNWSSPNQASYTHADIHYLRYHDGRFFAGTDGGVYVSSNDGGIFTDLTENLAISQFYKISVAAQNPGNVVGGLQDNGGYAFSDNVWNNYFGADGMDCAINPTNESNYFGFIQYGGVLYETTDGGKTRTGGVQSPNSGSLSGRWVTPLAASGDGEVYAGYNQLYRLEGSAWSLVSSFSFGGNLVNLKVDPKDSNVIFATRGSTIYRSLDKGATYESFFTSSGTINSIDISSESDLFYFVTNSGAYKVDTPVGASFEFIWELIGTSTPTESKLSIKHHGRSGNNTLYLGTSLGVYSMSDDDTEWQTFDNNLPNVAVRDLEINEEESILYAATYGRGVFTSEIPRQLPQADVKIISVENPIEGVNCSENFTPQILIKNQGADVLTAVTINYNFDGGASLVHNWSGSLNSEQTTIVDLPQASEALGVHTINVEVTTTNDAYATNNNRSASFSINSSTTTPTVVNSFENTGDELFNESNTSNLLWEIATPSKTLLNAAGSGTLAYITGATGDYPNNSTTSLYTSCYDLTQITTPVLSFKMAFDIEEDFDYLTVEYSTDTGTTWTTLGSASDANWYNSSSTINGLPGNQWTGEGEDSNTLGGTNATIHDYSYDLGVFASESNIVFRFKFITDSGTIEEGIMIDDMVVNGTLSVNNNEFSNIVSVYPNPSNGIFNIQWPNNEKTTISVYNYLGQKISEHKNITSGSYSLDLSNQSKGLYLLKINSNGKLASKKIILK
ncbi:MAG: T9SS type A sorting domain-containing protein [Flavobacteriaceae bacterium]|nr:T9SS type A sorting domain-containing protein [Flavobacteriaceae bacterium]